MAMLAYHPRIFTNTRICAAYSSTLRRTAFVAAQVFVALFVDGFGAARTLLPTLRCNTKNMKNSIFSTFWG
jgi:uncharacterized membrane protein YdcZ (DUF606 family)